MMASVAISTDGSISPGKNKYSRHVILLRVKEMPNINLF